jgi:alanine racemase
MLPTGHTDGYPAGAANTCSVLIGGRLYPIVASVASAHVIVEIGAEKTVEVGDVATLIGPDDPAITPHAVAEKTGVGFYPLITKMSPFLPRRVI